MKFTIKYTWDSKLAARRIKCLIRHDWEFYQFLMRGEHGDRECTLCVGFKVCKRCAKSKLVHIFP